jgi:hypothetical protein
MLSHLVLIPKVKNPTKPKHFWPLSICYVYYWLLIKFIARDVNEVRQTYSDPPDPTADPSGPEVKWIGPGRAKVQTGWVRV